MFADNDNADLSTLRIRRENPDPTPPKKRTRVIPVVAAAIVLLTVVYFFARGLLRQAVEVELATASLTYPSQARAVLTASGYVVAQRKAAVASKATGRLVYLGVEEGDRVRKGQVIARLEDQDVIAALEKARADLAVAVADSFDATQSLQRQRTLYAAGLVSEADLDAAQARYSRVKATIESSAAAVRTADVALEYTRIRAPFDGTVLSKDADVGEVVAPFAAAANSRAAVVSIADMSSLQVEADVSESNITRIGAGQQCEIVLDAYPDIHYRGIVHKIVPTADRSKATVLTKIAFEQRDDRVLPEMSAKVTFLSESPAPAQPDSAAALTVPSSAVVTSDGRTAVFVARDAMAVETPVTTGRSIGGSTEILTGLQQGDRVIVQPDAAIVTGTKIRPRSQ